MINDKDYVTHQDIKDILPYILRHRIKFLNQDEKLDFIKKDILEKIVIKK
jgi:MoxR-like ATPase